MKTIGYGDVGEAVKDVQRRLRVLGYELTPDGSFLDRTSDAVRDFRAKAGLSDGCVIDDAAWSALVDASFALGDRMLYLRMPYFHGGDVRSLQEILGTLGFIPGDIDGIFGAHTERAVREFQSSVGLIDDGIVGTTTFDAIARLKHAWEGKSPSDLGASEHMGYARAAEVLENLEACFYGLDGSGRRIASRVANLAWATTPAARITSAAALDEPPGQLVLKIGIATSSICAADGVPTVELSDDVGFPRRLATALASTGSDERVIVEALLEPESAQTQDGIDQERWEQHLAVLVLDAFCAALR